ncbi:hypothetical protein TRIUR3_25060 [Triticum urartu]|uniref:Uncharacterized protein n=1 Tax=Triticum urartu TaxID=4572 RepID=M8A8S1_TRIUA|nr:hypothetical protein TRIUR3_25060 [Triticum urartu]
MAPASRPPTATPLAASSSRIDSPSLKAALAMALIHYKRLPSTTAAAAAAAGTSSPPLIHWKRKAKERKREILRLREELKLLQDGVRGEAMEPPLASCRCHFFDGCSDLQPPPPTGGGEHWVDEVLRRRFLRLGPVDCSDAQFNVQHLFRKRMQEMGLSKRYAKRVTCEERPGSAVPSHLPSEEEVSGGSKQFVLAHL